MFTRKLTVGSTCVNCWCTLTVSSICSERITLFHAVLLIAHPNSICWLIVGFQPSSPTPVSSIQSSALIKSLVLIFWHIFYSILPSMSGFYIYLCSSVSFIFLAYLPLNIVFVCLKSSLLSVNGFQLLTEVWTLVLTLFWLHINSYCLFKYSYSFIPWSWS